MKWKLRISTLMIYFLLGLVACSSPTQVDITENISDSTTTINITVAEPTEEEVTVTEEEKVVDSNNTTSYYIYTAFKEDEASAREQYIDEEVTITGIVSGSYSSYATFNYDGDTNEGFHFYSDIATFMDIMEIGELVTIKVKIDDFSNGYVRALFIELVEVE